MELIKTLTWECIFPPTPYPEQLVVTGFWRPLPLALQKTANFVQYICQPLPLDHLNHQSFVYLVVGGVHS